MRRLWIRFLCQILFVHTWHVSKSGSIVLCCRPKSGIIEVSKRKARLIRNSK